MLRLRSSAAFAACAVVAVSNSVLAQEAPTPGGNVTADEASVLPPVVVQSPSEPVGKRSAPKRSITNVRPPTAGTATQTTAQGAGEGPAQSGLAAGGPAIGTGVFTLGQIDMIGGSTITNEAMWTFNKTSLDQAVNILPGVTSTNTGGARNERDIFVRGFNRYQVPLSIDGVRVYLPADNRLDFNRFLTEDIAEVQVAKGYVSVLDGPGGEGGAINLVSRRPTKAVELEGRVGTVMNGDLDSINSWSSYAYAGTKQRNYYAQISGTIIDQDHWNLSHDFTPTTPRMPQAANGEDGGDRDNSEQHDWRINVKAGYTPNPTDEYAINYTVQEGSKSAPLNVDGLAVQGPRFWQWPAWDTSNVSLLTKTQIGDASYVKTTSFYNTFYNVLSSYDDRTYATQSKTSPNTFNSFYDDSSYGNSIELGTNLIPMNTLKGAIHYRRDIHNEYNANQPDAVVPPAVEPNQESIEDTWSFAIENTLHVTKHIDFVAGGSYDLDIVEQAQNYGVPFGAPANTPSQLFNYPTPTVDAFNYQGGLIYHFDRDGETHFTVSSRTRFPTLFDRYSTRFDTRAANPYLQPERSTNYEIGLSNTIFRGAHFSTALFYSDLKDSIQNVYVAGSGSGSILGINADGSTYGLEVSGDWDIMPGLRIGGNYTYLERSFDFASATAGLTAAQAAAVSAAQPEGTPRHHAFLYLAWKPMERLTLTPNLEIASDRTSLITSCASTLRPLPATACSNLPVVAVSLPNYAAVGSYALVNFQAEYQFTDYMTGAFGATNLLDENYALAAGFPEPGRQFFANLRARF